MDEPLRGPVQPSDVEEEESEVVATADKPTAKKPTHRDEFHTRKERLAERHDEILRAIQNGKTLRVIHTEMGVSRGTLETYIKENSDLVEAWKDAKEDILDLNEEIVSEIATMDCSMNETENGSFPRMDGRSLATKFNAAKFRLERLGSKRGWNPKIETNEVGNGGRVPLIIAGEFSEGEIANNKALVEEANKAALLGLEGIPHG